MTAQAHRTHLFALMKYLVDHEPKVHYEMLRPMETVHWTEATLKTNILKPAGIKMDCSETVTALCHWAGLRNPNNGRKTYDGYGNTDTLYAYLPHYHDPRKARVGALALWGTYPDTHHVAMVYEPDPKHGNPLLMSHGQERGPILVRLLDEDAWQNRPRTMLSIARL